LAFVSDHALLLLHLYFPPSFKVFPFKFNEQWLGDKDFAELVERVWKNMTYITKTISQKRLIRKLQDLKAITKKWNKDEKELQKSNLLLIEDEIKKISDNLSIDFNNHGAKDTLRLLETERMVI
jgi:hypothetical protein